MISGRNSQHMSRGRLALVLALALSLALSGAWSAAEALTITQTLNFNDSVSVTDTTTGDGAATNNGATFGTQTPNLFNSSTGVLTAASIVLTSTRTGTVTGSVPGSGTSSATRTLTGAGSSTANITGPTVSQSFATALAVTESCTAQKSAGCSFSKGTGATTTDKTLNVASGDLNTYVGASTFNVTRTAPALSNTLTNGFSVAGTTTYTVGWTGSVATTYTYLAHAVASFASGSTQSSLLIDFGTVNQGQGGGQLASLFDIFNLLATDRTGLNLISITPDGGNSSQLTTNLATFNNLLTGGSNNFSAFLNTNTIGLFSAAFTLDFADFCPTGAASNTCLNLDDLTLTLQGNVVADEPLPPTLLMLVAGMMGLGGTYVVRRRFGRVSS